MIIGISLACLNCGVSSHELQEYHPKAVDIAVRCEMETGAVGQVEVSWCPLDLAADM